MDKCRWNYLATRPKFRCDTPFMPIELIPECDEFDPATDLFDVYQEWYDEASNRHCEGRCSQVCNISVYTAQIIKEEDDELDTQNTFHIYFPSGQTQVPTTVQYCCCHL